MSNKPTPIGRRPGDYVIVKNQFASVHITYEPYDADARRGYYLVSGDIKDQRLRSTTFAHWGQALAYALQSLAFYESGRAD